MANVLGELFQDIANAIRSKNGATGTMKPAQFPVAIAGIEVGSGSGADIDEIDFKLDEINGEIIGENLYHVTFIGADGTELGKVGVYEDYDCTDPVESGEIGTPTKASAGYYKYSYSGWSEKPNGTADANVLKGITANKTVYAAFTSNYLFSVNGVWDNLKWGIHSDNTLRIYGTGDMKFVSSASGAYPWAEYKSTVSRIIIDGGVTQIADSAFKDFTALTEVLFPADGVQANGVSIFPRAFQDCSSLKNITITVNVWAIFGFSFLNSGLTSAVFDNPNEWYLNDWDGLAITGLDDPTTAATLLKNIEYQTNWLHRREA